MSNESKTMKIKYHSNRLIKVLRYAMKKLSFIKQKGGKPTKRYITLTQFSLSEFFPIPRRLEESFRVASSDEKQACGVKKLRPTSSSLTAIICKRNSTLFRVQLLPVNEPER